MIVNDMHISLYENLGYMKLNMYIDTQNIQEIKKAKSLYKQSNVWDVEQEKEIGVYFKNFTPNQTQTLTFYCFSKNKNVFKNLRWLYRFYTICGKTHAELLLITHADVRNKLDITSALAYYFSDFAKNIGVNNSYQEISVDADRLTMDLNCGDVVVNLNAPLCVKDLASAAEYCSFGTQNAVQKLTFCTESFMDDPFLYVSRLDKPRDSAKLTIKDDMDEKQLFVYELN